MPRSRVRKKAVYTPPPDVRPTVKRRPSPRWLVPLMLTLFLLGIAWLAVYYITQGDLVGMLRALDAWNLAIGFGLIVAGFLLSTQWR